MLNEHSRTIRIFLSSTFRDMMSEREVLIKRVFPELNRFCMDRFVSLIEVDLRWGITEQEMLEGKVVELCLSEIDHARPYFLGIIGNRYGWCPTEEELTRSARIDEEFAWVKKDVQDGRSITNMEILYGALRDTSDESHSLFYLKEYDFDKTVYESEDERRLYRLRDEIRTQQKHKVGIYRDNEDLYQQVIADLKKAIEKEFPLAQTPDELELAEIRQRNLGVSKLACYVPPKDRFSQMLGETDHGHPLLVTGTHGRGLTSFAAFVADQLPAESIFFLHSCSVTEEGTKLQTMLYRLYWMLKKRVSLTLVPELEEDWLVENLPMLLNSVEEPLWIILDDVELLETKGGRSPIYWIPEQMPEGVHFVLTSHSETLAEDARELGLVVQELPLLTNEQQEMIISGYLQRYSKKLPDKQKNQLLALSLLDSPRMLRVVLDELRTFGLHEGLSDQIQDYCLCEDGVCLYKKVLHRVQLDFGEERVRRTLALVSLTEQGLYENELVEMLGEARLHCTAMLRSVAMLLESDDSLFVLRNEELAEAIREEYLSDSAYVSSIQREMISYAKQDLEGAFALRELPYLYRECRDLEALADYITKPEISRALYRKNPYRLATNLLAAAEAVDVDARYVQTYKNYKFMSKEDAFEYLGELSGFLLLNDHFDAAREFNLLHLELLSTEEGNEEERCHIHGELGTIYRKTSQYDLAETELKEALQQQKKLYGELNKESINTLNELADVYTVKGQHEEALELNEKALKCCEASVGEKHPLTAATYREIGWANEYLGRYQESLQALEKSLALFRQLFGSRHIETVSCLHAIAWIYDWLGDYVKVHECAQLAYETASALCGENHSLTGMSYKLMAVAEYREEEYEQALLHNEKALSIFKKLYRGDHSRISVQYFQIGLALIKLRRFSEAAGKFRESIEMDWRIVGNDEDGDFAISYNYYGFALAKSGELEKGMEYLKRGQRIAEHEYGKESSDYADSLYLQGILLREQGKEEMGRSLLQEACLLRVKLFGEDNPETIEIKKALGEETK